MPAVERVTGLGLEGPLIGFGAVEERVDATRNGIRARAALEGPQSAVVLVDDAHAPVLGIGVGSPGIVDDHGVVQTAANIDSSWIGVDARELFGDRLGRDVLGAVHGVREEPVAGLLPGATTVRATFPRSRRASRPAARASSGSG